MVDRERAFPKFVVLRMQRSCGRIVRNALKSFSETKTAAHGRWCHVRCFSATYVATEAFSGLVLVGRGSVERFHGFFLVDVK
jgi:hypothetical protein